MSGGVIELIGQKLDRVGLRKAVAVAASLAYGITSRGKQRFAVDDAGRWLNRQPEGTIASPNIHTARFAAYRAVVLDNWAWQYSPQAGDVIVDVGAGVGEEAVVFSDMVGGTGRVISIEAHPETFSCLKKTIAESGLANVTSIYCAVAELDGTAFIADACNHLANSIMKGAKGSKVPARSLDSLGAELGLDKIALLKMNIEGAERLAIPGMRELSTRIRHVAISCHDFISDRDGGDEFRTSCEVRRNLESFGFEVTTRPDHENPWVRYYLYGRNTAL